MPSGASTTFPDDVLLDTAVLYRDVASVQTVWGASRGGLTFDPGKQMRSVGYDGKRAKRVKQDRVTGWDAKITGTMIEIGASLVTAIEPGATPAFASSKRTYTNKDASVMYGATDYHDNVRLTYQRANGGTYSILFPKAVVTEYKLTGSDNDEAQCEITIEARNPTTAQETDCPFFEEITGPDITS